jgi:hypothetical protein
MIVIDRSGWRLANFGQMAGSHLHPLPPLRAHTCVPRGSPNRSRPHAPSDRRSIESSRIESSRVGSTASRPAASGAPSPRSKPVLGVCCCVCVCRDGCGGGAVAARVVLLACLLANKTSARRKGIVRLLEMSRAMRRPLHEQRSTRSAQHQAIDSIDAAIIIVQSGARPGGGGKQGIFLLFHRLARFESFSKKNSNKQPLLLASRYNTQQHQPCLMKQVKKEEPSRQAKPRRSQCRSTWISPPYLSPSQFD